MASRPEPAKQPLTGNYPHFLNHISLQSSHSFSPKSLLFQVFYTTSSRQQYQGTYLGNKTDSLSRFFSLSLLTTPLINTLNPTPHNSLSPLPFYLCPSPFLPRRYLPPSLSPSPTSSPKRSHHHQTASSEKRREPVFSR